MPAGVMWRYMLCLLGGALEGDKPNQQSQLGDSQTFKVFKGRFFSSARIWRSGAVLGGAPAARGCSMEGGRRLLLGDLPLRGAAPLRGEGGCFWGTSRCAGLLNGGAGKEAAFGGAPAARGCSTEGGRRLFWGGAPAARGCSMAGRGGRLLLGELIPLRGAARLREGGGCFWGSSHCAGLLNGRGGKAAFGGAPAARGCSIEGGRRLLLGELPLSGAARLREEGGCF